MLNGASGRSRTDKPRRVTDFESAAFTSFATEALIKLTDVFQLQHELLAIHILLS